MENLAGQKIHPGWLRITHWVNAVSIVIMVMSGWRIYNSSPIFPFKFPADITLGGWLAGALQWHFAAMWLLVANGLIYLLLNFITGRFWRKFFPLSIAGFLQDSKAALKGHLMHEDLSKYNMVQKIAYLLVILDVILLVVSGLVIWKSV